MTVLIDLKGLDQCLMATFTSRSQVLIRSLQQKKKEEKFTFFVYN